MPKLCIARPTGFKLEAADVGTWLFHLTNYLRQLPEIEHVTTYSISNPRILMMRNACVKYAQEQQCTHLLFLDPDHRIDAYVNRDPKAVPFFPTAWKFLKENPRSIIAAPYCGMPPLRPVHVFSKGPDGECRRVTREQAATLDGITEVDAVGTGLMLIDMAAFEGMPHPYFDDLYTDETKSKLHLSQDVYFCRKAAENGVKMYVHWNCWAVHWQNCMIERPGWEEPKPPDSAAPSIEPERPKIPKLVIAGSGDKSWS